MVTCPGGGGSLYCVFSEIDTTQQQNDKLLALLEQQKAEQREQKEAMER
jgi:hypothetical protein